ncbi:MAG: ATP-binding cassette domain-containing protein [Nitrososphaerales archaeon]
MSQKQIISVKDLVEVYADGTKAVDGISFEVNDGEIFGFLGPNGAGKSTTIKILTTLLRKTSGSVNIAGHDLEANPKEIRKLIGVQSQETAIDPELTGRENMILQGNLQQMRGNELIDRVNYLLDIVGLKEAANKRAGRYSGGMKKRLDLASILVHKPKILFLDEPTTGLDPQSRATVWDYLEQLNSKEGITIFLTTQYLEEADRLCQRLCIVDGGKIVAAGTPSELKNEIGADAITIVMQDKDGKSVEAVRSAGREILKSLPEVANVVDSGDGLTVYAKNGGYFIPELVRAFDKTSIKLVSINLSTPSLDDVFLKHTGKRIRVEEVAKQAPSMIMGRGRKQSK